METRGPTRAPSSVAVPPSTAVRPHVLSGRRRRQHLFRKLRRRQGGRDRRRLREDSLGAVHGRPRPLRAGHLERPPVRRQRRRSPVLHDSQRWGGALARSRRTARRAVAGKRPGDLSLAGSRRPGVAGRRSVLRRWNLAERGHLRSRYRPAHGRDHLAQRLGGQPGDAEAARRRLEERPGRPRLLGRRRRDADRSDGSRRAGRLRPRHRPLALFPSRRAQGERRLVPVHRR